MDQVAREAEQREATAGAPEGPLLQVLVVEDDFGDLALVENAFDEHSIRSELHHVGDGSEALAFLRREGAHRDAPRPDLILLDLNMPRVDGRQALAEIKADPVLKSIPTIVFTTSSLDSDVIASYSRHANAYITKPIDLDDYERVVMAIRNFYGHLAVLPRRSPDQPTF
ncbi:response regulator [Actinoplanes sp. NPDC051859]|uniref:response regulator n=1 Tax=Actinoplanes sp. NPDC051859 TaxID=3363909 RepID=UPI0037A35313